MELLATVDCLTIVAKALNEVKERATSSNSNEGNSISSSLTTLAKASECLATKIKLNAEKTAPISNLSYAHNRRSTHKKRITGTNVAIRKPKALASIENHVLLKPESSKKQYPPANNEGNAATSTATLPSHDENSFKFPCPSNGMFYSPSETVAIVSSLPLRERVKTVKEWMHDGLVPFTNICTYFRVMKRISTGEKPPEFWNNRGRTPYLSYTELQELQASLVGSQRSIGGKDISAFIMDKKRKSMEEKGIQVLVPWRRSNIEPWATVRLKDIAISGPQPTC
jgi:hypothetical protein